MTKSIPKQDSTKEASTINSKYWYRDNWVGNKKEFETLPQAKQSARNETGVSVAIYNQKGQLVCIAPASCFTPA